ncbi:hypothetical protein [Ornithinimicrobium kibberense]|uniref:hypothetical protein n=1 Tax=Ornithinimicrobium kibberense TaxID=282060 RepID=UPI003610338C
MGVQVPLRTPCRAMTCGNAVISTTGESNPHAMAGLPGCGGGHHVGQIASTTAVSSPAASPVLTTPRGSSRRALTSPSARGQSSRVCQTKSPWTLTSLTS